MGDGWRNRRRRDGEKEENTEAHFYQSELFDSAERVTLVKKTKAVSLSLSLSHSPALFFFSLPPSLNLPVTNHIRYNRRCTLTHLFNNSFWLLNIY